MFGPANVNEAIRRAKDAERGEKQKLDHELRQRGIDGIDGLVNDKPQTNTPRSQNTTTRNTLNQTPVIESEVDDLTKQMEQLKINKLEREINTLRNQLGGNNYNN